MLFEGAEILSLTEYIDKYHNGRQIQFAKANGVEKSQVTQWVKKNFIVINGELYSIRRKLKKEADVIE